MSRSASPITRRATRRADATTAMTTLRLSLALAAAVATAGCSDSTGIETIRDPAPAFSIAAEQAVAPSLHQRVRLSTTQPARGDTLVIRSVITNRGTTPARVEHTVCGFDYAPNDVLQSPFILCMAYSATTTLAPGDSISHEDRRVVAGRPGQHPLRLAHLVDPKSEVAISLTVR
jgi:hypothetical protein